MSVNLAVGTKLPAVYTAMGRMLLAYLDDEQLTEYLDRVPIRNLTNFSITDPLELRELLRRASSEGWAVVDQELEIGVRSVAVPIHDHTGRVIAAINTSAHVSRVSLATLEAEFLPRLQQAASAIDADLALRR